MYVHLQSAFAAQNTADPELSEAYHKVSRIDYLKELIIQQVRTKGQFYRVKNFIDIISTPMLSSMENLIQQSLINSAQGRTILSKKENWRHGRKILKELHKLESNLALLISKAN